MFNQEFLLNASKHIEVKSIATDLTFIKSLVTKALVRIKKTIPNAVVETYIHGSYANATNIFFPSNLEVCVELKLPKYEYSLTGDYYVNHELDYGPREFRQDLFDAINEQVESPDASCKLNKQCIVVPKHKTLMHVAEITPCVEFVLTDDNGGEQKGILVHDAKIEKDIPTFPILHQKHGQTKDVRCEGNFKKFVRMFKTIKAIAGRENKNDEYLGRPVRGYFIECLIYNVPDSLFHGVDLHDGFLKIMNYLAHIDIKTFQCQNHVWDLIGSAGEFWNEKDANAFVTAMKIFYREFPKNRTNLA